MSASWSVNSPKKQIKTIIVMFLRSFVSYRAKRLFSNASSWTNTINQNCQPTIWNSARKTDKCSSCSQFELVHVIVVVCGIDHPEIHNFFTFKYLGWKHFLNWHPHGGMLLSKKKKKNTHHNIFHALLLLRHLSCIGICCRELLLWSMDQLNTIKILSSFHIHN